MNGGKEEKRDGSETARAVLAAQKAYFETGETKNASFRKAQLKQLKEALSRFEPELLAALRADLGKGGFEAYCSEIGVLKQEIRHLSRHLNRWARPRRAPTPLMLFSARGYICPEPRGSVLILSPWNYPLFLTLAPLAAAMAAGNCAVLKPSGASPHVTGVLDRLIGETFPPDYIRCLSGGRELGRALLEAPFDSIFFTGGQTGGRLVLEAAAKHLTPVTLELGGKSPCLVHRDADLSAAARRVAFGKFLNAGQTCVAPDYLLVHRAVKDRFLALLAARIRDFYGEDPGQSPDFARIVNDRQFHRLTGLLEGCRILYGGSFRGEDRYFSPTLVEPNSPDAPVMREEIFGPILPVLTYETLPQALGIIARHPKPLALYVFSANKGFCRDVLRSVPCGGGCVNDTVLHLAAPGLPFGGVGSSGMGAYRGKAGFDTFTHYKSILENRTKPDFALRYPPYTQGKTALARRLFR